MTTDDTIHMGTSHTDGVDINTSIRSAGLNPPSSVAMPRAIIHKKILNAAQRQPNASIEELATSVSGASVELIERVLDEYGDPAESDPQTEANGTTEDANGTTTGDQTAQSSNTTGETMTEQDTKHTPDADSIPDPAQLSDKQRQTFHAIYKHPDATQRDLAERLNVSDSTISGRVNAIEGFKWETRTEFVEAMIENGTLDGSQSTQQTQSVSDICDRIDELGEDMRRLSERLEERSVTSSFDTPELSHKIVHACMKSEHITEDEELMILKDITT